MRMKWRNHWSDCLDLWKVSRICISWYTDELSIFIVIGIIEHSLNLATNYGLYKTKKMLNETTKRNKQLHCSVARSIYHLKYIFTFNKRCYQLQKSTNCWKWAEHTSLKYSSKNKIHFMVKKYRKMKDIFYSSYCYIQLWIAQKRHGAQFPFYVSFS